MENVIKTKNTSLILALGHPYIWLILIDDKEFVKMIYENLPKEREEEIDKIIDILKQEYPDIYK